MKIHRLAGTAFATAVLAVAAPHASALSTWTFSTGACNQSGSSYGNSWSCGSGSSQVTATAWSTATNTGGTGNYRDARLDIHSGSGFGVVNREQNNGDARSPEHAMDNERGSDLIALSFAQSVSLSSLSIGWYSGDSDLSILAYTGAGTPPSLSGKSASSLLSAGSGWTLIGNYANTAPSENINAANISSSWWLISAYNSAFGSGSGSIGMGNDYVKLLSVAGSPYQPPPPPPGVPEPGTLALAGVALLGAWRMRRQTKAGGAA